MMSLKKPLSFLFIILTVGLCFAFYGVMAQGVGINDTGANPDASAVLDVDAINKGMLIPRLTTAQRDAIASPADFLQILNTTTRCFEIYNANAQIWESIFCLCTTPATPIVGSNSPICLSDTLFLTATSLDATSYHWTGPNGFVSSAQNPFLTEMSFEQAGIYTVTTASGNCVSPGVTVNVVVKPSAPDSPEAIIGSMVICKNSVDEIYSIDAVANAETYTWSVPQDATITAGQGTTAITVTFGSLSGEISVIAENSCGMSEPMTLALELFSGSKTFSYSGNYETFIVPNCVTEVTLDLYGAQGWDSVNGGKGGRATGTLAVTPGETLYVYVGQSGVPDDYVSWNGGGKGGSSGGGGSGGGASDVRIGGQTLGDRIIVAGGGGAKGHQGVSCWVNGIYTKGGAGGGDIGQAGTTYDLGKGGAGGTQSAGGAGGTGGNQSDGQNGTLGLGGNSSFAGGGGGYYGGGGGGSESGCHRGGGGGGSNYLGGVTPINNLQGVQSGDGKIIISWE